MEDAINHRQLLCLLRASNFDRNVQTPVYVKTSDGGRDQVAGPAYQIVPLERAQRVSLGRAMRSEIICALSSPFDVIVR
jgi:hypothetical protein